MCAASSVAALPITESARMATTAKGRDAELPPERTRESAAEMAGKYRWRIRGYYNSETQKWEYELFPNDSYPETWGTWAHCIEYMRIRKLSNSHDRRGMITG
jgi:hypothetical protein